MCLHGTIRWGPLKGPSSCCESAISFSTAQKNSKRVGNMRLHRTRQRTCETHESRRIESTRMAIRYAGIPVSHQQRYDHASAVAAPLFWAIFPEPKTTQDVDVWLPVETRKKKKVSHFYLASNGLLAEGRAVLLRQGWN